MYCGITRRNRDMLVVSANKFFVSELSQYKKKKKNGTSVHHSICVHIGNKLFIVHMALPFFVSFVPWASAFVRHLGWWWEEGDWDSLWGGSSAGPAPQSTRRGGYSWCNSNASSYREPWLTPARPSTSQLSTSSCNHVGQPQHLLPESVKDGGLQLFSHHHSLSHCISCHHWKKPRSHHLHSLGFPVNKGRYWCRTRLPRLGGCKLKSVAQHGRTRTLRGVIC